MIQLRKIQFRSPFGFVSISVCALAVLMVLSLTLPALQHKIAADTYSDQLAQLRASNAEKQALLNGLASEASTYQDTIASLQTQIETLQTSIDANLAKQKDLKTQIDEAKAELERQRATLAEDIKAMYVDGTPSSFEILASSNNLSDYVDKEEYRNRVQEKIKTTMDRITELEKQLQQQKAEVEQLLREQQTQQMQLDADKLKQQELLAYNQAQQDEFTQQVRANNAEMARVQAAQRAALAAVSGTSSGSLSSTSGVVRYENYTGGMYCGGGYSYCWAGFDQVVYDPWGLNWARECVHYAADRLQRDGKRVPNFGGGNGYAYKWVGFTTANGYATLTSDPQPGDIAYIPLSGYGHVAVVEYVNSNGTVHISQMNWPYGGYYSELDLYITPGVQFMRFSS